MFYSRRKAVVSFCYGKELAANYKGHLKVFRENYKALKISITPKVHAAFFHVGEFCELMKMGISPWNKQMCESLHHDFNTVWENFKVRDTKHPSYAERLLNAVIIYNSQHL